MPSDNPAHRQQSDTTRQMASSRIPPSEQSPYRDAERGMTLTQKLLVVGGTGVLAAAATAGTVLLGRCIHDAISGPPKAKDRPNLAPRFAEMDEDAREEVRRHMRKQAREDSQEATRIRAGAARKREEAQRNPAQDMTRTALDLTRSLTGLVTAISSVVTVAQLASNAARVLSQELSDTADRVNGGYDRSAQRRPPQQDDDGRG